MIEEVHARLLDQLSGQVAAQAQAAAAPSYGSSYVSGAGRGCVRGGCQAAALMNVADRAAAAVGVMIEREEKRVQPTRALWCEQGGHSFSEKDPGRRVLSINVLGDDGDESEEGRTVCGGCASRLNLGKPRTHPELETLPGHGRE